MPQPDYKRIREATLLTCPTTILYVRRARSETGVLTVVLSKTLPNGNRALKLAAVLVPVVDGENELKTC